MRVGLYPTCTVDVLTPAVGEAAVRLLGRLGIEVTVPDAASCCGQPGFNAGHWGPARSVGLGFLDAVERLLESGADAVVMPSGSCAAMVHHGLVELMDLEPGSPGAARLHRIRPRVRELSQFLVHDLGIEDVGASCAARATYHPSCHGQRVLGVTDEPLRLLRKVRGLELVELPYAQDCCGFGGTFAIKMGPVSGAMVDEKARHVAETGADLLIVNDMACGINVRGRLERTGAGIPVRHWVEVLAQGN